jgi:SAM-dependent methyltransferase
MEDSPSFYSSISYWYDQIFPYKPAHVQFIYDHTGRNGQREILDMGCATGSLALALAGEGHAVYGMDDDEQMIHHALKKKKAQGFKQYPVFKQLDMTRAGEEFEAESFEVVTCFGNTLVHLPGEEAIEDLLRSVHRLLKGQGYFLFQILNYDYILAQRVMALPGIENERIAFERHYESRSDGRLDFVTRLYVKSDDKIIHNRLPLYPIRKSSLRELVHRAGFQNVNFYSNFNKEPFALNSMPLVVSARSG